MGSYKRIVFVFIFVLTSVIATTLGVIYIYDPMQIFHKSYFNKEMHLHGNMRQQAAGIINNYEFDSIIIGTSMLENTSSVDASKLLGGKFVNISLSGSDFYERQLVLSYALRKKDIKTVIYSLDAKYLNPTKGRKNFPIETFSYLYDRNPFNDFRVYQNKKFIKCSLSLSESEECIGKATTLEYPNAWYKSKAHSVRFGGLNNWFKAKNNGQVKKAFSGIVSNAHKIKNKDTISLLGSEEKVINAKQYMDETILPMVQEYPQTKFILIFPPYSRIAYASWAQYNLPNYITHKKIIEYLVMQSSKYKNLQIYGFEDQDFLDDIIYYKDPTHYHYSINSQILLDVHRKNGLLNRNNVTEYVRQSEEKALGFNYVELGEKIENYLNSTHDKSER